MKQLKSLFCNIYKLYNSYFVMFGNFVNFVIFGFLDMYIFIYYTCRSLTRVGLLRHLWYVVIQKAVWVCGWELKGLFSIPTQRVVSNTFKFKYQHFFEQGAPRRRHEDSKGFVVANLPTT